MSVPDHTRRRILDAAATVLARHPDGTLADIAVAAGIGRTTLHRVFPTRHVLLLALAEDAIDRLGAALAEARLDAGDPPAVALERITAAVLPLADELRFLDAGADIWKLPELVERWYDVGRPLEVAVRSWQRERLLRPDLPPAWIVDLFVAAVFAASTGIADGRIARRDAVALVLATVLRGVEEPQP